MDAEQLKELYALRDRAHAWLCEPARTYTDLLLVHMPSFDEWESLTLRRSARKKNVSVTCRLWDSKVDEAKLEPPQTLSERLRHQPRIAAPSFLERAFTIEEPALNRLLDELASIQVPMHLHESSVMCDGTPVEVHTRSVIVRWNIASELQLGPLTPRLTAWFESAWQALFRDPRQQR
jgi:hypothetical protein